jgi:ankyrin repeat protein
LHYAARSGSQSLVQLLLEYKADVDIPEALGNTPLICAAEQANEGTAKVLLNYNANIGARNWEGQTALHVAATGGEKHVSIVKLLLDNGADIEAPDECGRTPIDGAHHPSVVQVLCNKLRR